MLFINKIAATFLLIIYLVSATATDEFLKIPLLVSHYYDHKVENKEINLLSFLISHYINEDGTDKDASEDKKLPFKSTEHFASFSFISLIPPSIIEVDKPERECNSGFDIYQDFFFVPYTEASFG